MRLFQRVLLGLGAFLLVGSLVWFGGLGPFGPIPGGVLFGTATSSVDVDWSFTDAIGEIEVQTRLFGLAMLLLSCGPSLDGERVTEPVHDWTFVSEREDLELVTAAGNSFRYMLWKPLVQNGALYLQVSTLFSIDDDALLDLLEDPRLQLSSGGRIYSARARQLTTPEEIDPLLPILLLEGAGIEATRPRYDPSPERYPGTQLRQWFFRIESDTR